MNQAIDHSATYLADRLPGVVYTFRIGADGAMNFPYMSSRAAEVMDASPEELRSDGSKMLERVHPEDLPAFQAGMMASLERLSPFDWRGRFTMKSGEIRWIRAASTPERQTDGATLWFGQLIDVTEDHRRVEAAEHTASTGRLLLNDVVSAIADGVCVVDATGKFTLFNKAAERILGMGAAEAETSEWADLYGIFELDGVTRVDTSTLPLVRALGGEVDAQKELFIRNAALPKGVTISVTAAPLRDAAGAISGAVAVFRDVSERRALEQALTERAEALAKSEAAKSELIGRLRLAVDELSTPILEVSEDVLALPIIGVVDSQRAAQVIERLLEEVTRKQCRVVIIDVTGVEVIDTRTADYFLKMIKAVELLGAECLISGIRPAVAQALVDLGIDLGQVRTSRSLRTALTDSIRAVADQRRHRPRGLAPIAREEV
jgi:rsbT co-antagonist protein RsbR